MKICCSQEHYDKVVQYAKSINDKTLENCLERLKQWEKNDNRPCEIELYYDHAPYSFGFRERYPDGNTGIKRREWIIYFRLHFNLTSIISFKLVVYCLEICSHFKFHPLPFPRTAIFTVL